MFSKEKVDEYINTSILRAEGYIGADKDSKKRAINQSINTLMEQLELDKEELIVRDVAEQTVFLFKIDGTIERAEMGVSSVSVDGISISISNVDTTLAPSIKNRYGIKDTKKRRAGRYVVDSLPFKRGHLYLGQ